MQPVGKLICDAPVERVLKTVQKRFSRRQLNRRNRGGVLEPDTLAAGTLAAKLRATSTRVIDVLVASMQLDHDHNDEANGNLG